MKHFLDTTETIPARMGFAHFSPEHWIELAVFVLLAVFVCLRYRRGDSGIRQRMRRILAVLLIADELFKHTCLLLGGNWLPSYLPLHLCSINLFLAAVHAWRPSKSLGGFLYCVCFPAAMAALLFPNWSDLPMMNFMRLHSLSVHILLALYPLMLLCGGEVDRSFRRIPVYLLILLALAAVALGANLVFDTNFMFLMYAPEGNPLGFFETALGSHLFGFPIIIAPLVVLLHLPLPKKLRKKDLQPL